MSRNPPLRVVGHQAPDEAGQLSRYGGYRHISLLTYPCHVAVITGNTAKGHGIPHNEKVAVENLSFLL